MDQPLRMHGRQAAPGLEQDVERFAWRGFGLLGPLPQRPSVHELHRDEHRRIVWSDVEHGNHVGVRQAGQRLCLSNDAGGRARTVGHVVTYDFDREPTIELRIDRLEHGPHRTGAQLANEFVAVAHATQRL